ncbi:tumor necrosis factor receptor superfamily member wengen isoform X1 [Leptidea sinapis]|uniref:tumor necrosis factor receptor superfamily member wengen isoform X1 n=2 Tax=Leptidea sinapis TaxID=189913 RepID=UPI00212097EA|nr:tumor necrosis factor receptor superfamily member wengen isoform X1 [Leptidea sinapis]
MNLSSKVMRGEITGICLLIGTLALSPVLGSGACERGKTWWNPELSNCVLCTRCDPRLLAVKYPCEVHRDTICQPLHEVRIWPFNTSIRKDNDSSASESDDYDYYEYKDYSGEVNDSSNEWGVQASTLALAASGCVVFFVVVVTLSLYHARQWRLLKQALKSDVEELSAKLRLMESGEAPAEPIVSTDHHLYCNIHFAKDALIGPGAKGWGNVYTQGHSP